MKKQINKKGVVRLVWVKGIADMVPELSEQTIKRSLGDGTNR